MKTDDICTLIIRNTEEVYPRYMLKVNDIDIDYFDTIARDSEELPPALNPGLKPHVVSELRKFARALLQASGLRARIEALAPSAEEMDEVRERVRSNGLIHSLDNGDAGLTDADLARLLRDAKRRTLWERVTQTNKADVHQYHTALQRKTYEECKDAYYTVLNEYLEEI